MDNVNMFYTSVLELCFDKTKNNFSFERLTDFLQN